MKDEPIESETVDSSLPMDDCDDTGLRLSPEDIPDVEELVIEDGKPVDNFLVEREYRLLTEPLYTCWRSSRGRFLATANVGLFFAYRQPPLVPDVMLSLGMPPARDLTQKENQSYFLWVIGKPPDVVIEIVSDLRGKEDTDKLLAYASIGIPYYVIFDPRNRLRKGALRAFHLLAGKYHPVEASWLENVELGLTFWEGEFQGDRARWLRWCDREGVVIPTGKERAEQEELRAEQEKLRATQEAQRATQEAQRATQEAQRATQEAQRATQEAQRVGRLLEQLRALGVEPKE